jgi:hypothetical protein
VYTPSGEMYVYYVNSSNNAMMYWGFAGGKWYNGEVGGKVAANTSPAAVYTPSGEMYVYYVNSSNNAMMYWGFAGGKWYNGELGGKVAAYTV